MGKSWSKRRRSSRSLGISKTAGATELGSLLDDHDQWAGQPNQLITKLEDSLDYSVFSLNGLNHPLSSEADSDSLPIQYSMGIVGGLIQAPLN